MGSTVRGVGEFESRLRAARGYAGLTQEQLATRMGVGLSTVKRWETRARDRDAYEERSLAERVGDATGVPVAFFFAPLQRLEASDDTQLARIERRLDEIIGLLAPGPTGPSGAGGTGRRAGTPADEHAARYPRNRYARSSSGTPLTLNASSNPIFTCIHATRAASAASCASITTRSSVVAGSPSRP
jgi:transcriptional regulator with XRE-family HTH domain